MAKFWHGISPRPQVWRQWCESLSCTTLTSTACSITPKKTGNSFLQRLPGHLRNPRCANEGLEKQKSKLNRTISAIEPSFCATSDFYRTAIFYNSLMIRAGLPPTMVRGGTALATTAPAAITDPSPTVTPGRIVAPPPIHTSLPMVTGSAHSRPSRRSSGSVGWQAV